MFIVITSRIIICGIDGREPLQDATYFFGKSFVFSFQIFLGVLVHNILLWNCPEITSVFHHNPKRKC